jgi:hypothetical protein
MLDPYPALSRDDLVLRLQSAETVITEQRKLLQAKETMLQKYMQQFTQLTSDYEHMIDCHHTTGWAERHQPSFMNSFDEPDLDFQAPIEVPRPQPPDRFALPETAPESEPPAQPAPVEVPPWRRALVSSITFGDDSPPAKKPTRAATGDQLGLSEKFAVVDTAGMSVDQMRAKVDELNVERATLEQQLNKALPKGKVMSHLLREREETETQFNEISKVIAKLKLDIRQAAAR